MKKIAVRFCGGCRASYDRSAWVRRLLEELRQKGCLATPEYDLEEWPQVGLIIGGCESQCLARTADFPKQWHAVGPNNMFDNTLLPFESIIQCLFDELCCINSE